METPAHAPDQPPARGPIARPIGVTVLAILAAIGGVLLILSGLTLAGISGAIADTGLGGMATVVGFVVILVGVLYLVLTYGLWTLKPWAWTLGVGLQGASILLTIIQLIGQMLAPSASSPIVGAVVALAIPTAILFYLFRPHVKAAFGRA